MKNDIIPIFTSDASLGKSILTADDPESVDKNTGKKYFKEIDGNAAISIWTIARDQDLSSVFVLEDSFISFINHYKYSKKLNKQLIFGIRFKIVENAKDPSEENSKTESNVIVWMKNSAGYNDLIRLYTAIHANKDHYIWDKWERIGYNRGDWNLLQQFWTDNLEMTIPFYDSFLHKNLLKHDYRAVPNFGKIKPNFILESHNLPFDDLISDSVLNYCKSNKYDHLNGHSIFYYKKEDAQAFQIFKCIHTRTTYEMPDMPYFSQPTFSFESWLERINE